nr:N-acetyltransferase [Lysinibacillus timonensis]
MLGVVPYKVYVLTKVHLPEVLALQEVVMEALPNKDTLQPLSEDEFLYMLEGNGLLIGVYIEDKLIAFRAVVVPKIDEEHLGYDLGLVEESDLQRIMYQEISNVHPNYRGHGLQKTMAKVIMGQIEPSKFDYLCTTVMPYNIASLKDKFSQGFYIIALKTIYGGKLRYVFAHDLQKEPQYEEETIIISMGDREGQQQLLKQGYVGVLMKQVDDDWFVEYRRQVK